MTGISICITAYNAKKFIRETLDSFYRQTWFKDHDNWEIIVGVDGCQETADYIRVILNRYDSHLKVLMMNSNGGTYITTNTIMKEAKYDNILRFDSDDIIKEDGIDILSNYFSYDMVFFKMKNFGIKNTEERSIGVHMIKKSIFEYFGGYQPWKCSADSELIKRISKFINKKVIDDIIFYRRTHNNSLTRKKGETQLINGRGSLRQQYIKYVKSLNIKNIEDAIITCTTNTFYYIDSTCHDLHININDVDNIDIYESSHKKVIYTCVLNDEQLYSVSNMNNDYDYVCFTDKQISVPGWIIKPIPDELKAMSEIEQRNSLKIQPHKYLSEYELSIWIDNINYLYELDKLNFTLQSNKSVYMRRNNFGCIYKYANKCIENKKDTSFNIRTHIFKYQRENFPTRYGLANTSIIIRKHNDDQCKKLMNLWYNEVTNSSYIDQLSFDYCLWKTDKKCFENIR